MTARRIADRVDGGETPETTPPADIELLRHLWTPELDPPFWRLTRIGVVSAWLGHAPFAHWIVRAARPRVLVELGTHNGVSYSAFRSEEHTSELQSLRHLVCRLLLEKKK